MSRADIDGAFVTVALPDGIERRYRNHELDRLQSAINVYGSDVLVQERWGSSGFLLRVGASFS